MSYKRNPIYDSAYNHYIAGMSLSEVASVVGVTRQCVYKAFKKRHFKLRSPNENPFQIYNGLKFSLRNHGYYSLTSNTRCLMHRYVWENEVGIIPNGWDIHHKNGDKADNRLNNLECLPKSEHTRQHQAKKKEYDSYRPICRDRRL